MTYTPPPCKTCGAATTVMETRKRSDGTIARRLVCPENHRVTVKQAPPPPKPNVWGLIANVFSRGQQ